MDRLKRVRRRLRELELLPTEGRPLSQSTRLSVMWEERKPMYEAFRDAVIDNNGSMEETVNMIWREFCENSGT